MTLKAVLFDLDGTLLDTAADFTSVLNAMLDRHNMPSQSYNAVRQHVSNGARAVVGLGFSMQEGDDGFVELVNEFLDRYAEALSHNTSLFPGLDDVLKKLERQGLQWGIVTNKPARFTEPLLKALNLDERCGTSICPDHVTHRKPHPEPMFLACKELDIAPTEAIYVGDHLRDIEAGRAAGMVTVACRYGYIPEDQQAEDWLADYVIDAPAELNDIVAKFI